MKISVVAPVLNEFPWIGYSVLAALPYVHEFIYAVDSASSDKTLTLLDYVKSKYAGDKLKHFVHPTFPILDEKAYDAAFNACIDRATGDAVWYLHPDMIVTGAGDFKADDDTLAWYTSIVSYAGDLQTRITQGRDTKWKNIHRKRYGLIYSGGYGSQNEDFYHSDVTGNAYKHFGEEFSKYPFPVADSGFTVNHYCEVKSYKRRYEKMKLCLKAMNPSFDETYIDQLASTHPRVTLQPGQFVTFERFEFKKTSDPIPDVITKYQEEFKGDLHG